MTDYPSRGTKPWDLQLKAYLEEGAAAVDSRLDAIEVLQPLDPLTAEPQTLVLDTVFTYYELSNNNADWYADPPADLTTIVADTNRALPRGEVGWVVATQSDGGADGIYIITDLGAAGVRPWVLTRHEDFNTAEALHRSMVFRVGKAGSLDGPNAPNDLEGWDGVALLSVDLTEVNQTLIPTDYPYVVSISHASAGYSRVGWALARAEGYASYAEGYGARAVGSSSHAEGSGTLAEGTGSHAEGSVSHARWRGSHARAIGRFTTTGDAQLESVVLRSTGNAVLATFTGATIPLPTGMFATFRASIICVKTDGTKAKSFEITGMVENFGGTPTLVASTKTVVADLGPSGYDITVAFTAAGLVLTPSGSPSRSVATVWFTEVGTA